MKNMFNFHIICGLLLFCVPGHIYSVCPQVETFPNFKAERFMGKWYEIEKYLKFWDTVGGRNCITFDYEMNSNGTVTVVNSEDKMYGLATFNPVFPASWLLQYSLMGFKGPSSQYSILETDYENYALTFSCYSLPVENIEDAWILSRTPTLNSTVIDSLKAILSTFRSPTILFYQTEQTNCPNRNSTDLSNKAC